MTVQHTSEFEQFVTVKTTPNLYNGTTITKGYHMPAETIVAPSKPTLKCPSLYKVIIYDDDISTYSCVMSIMINYFNANEDDAFRFTTKVDIDGVATAGIYPKDVAETKISLAKTELQSNNYPLRMELFEST